jgi:hypothetical protein
MNAEGHSNGRGALRKVPRGRRNSILCNAARSAKADLTAAVSRRGGLVRSHLARAPYTRSTSRPALPAWCGGGGPPFLWYRTTLIIPANVGDFDTTGAKAVFTAHVDDYAEVWINGQMPQRSGYPSPATIQGSTCRNRVVLAESQHR